MSSVALLFSDIEGSTKLLQRLGPSYASVLQEHHRILRHCFSAHNGREQSTEGDSFFVLFDAPKQAVAAALEAQRALARHAWPEGINVRVRMGVHTGEVSTVGDGLVGMAIHEAARIMSSAHGGQVLASSVTATLAEPLPADARWVDVGKHVLKDLPAPLHLMQLVHPELAQDLRPPRSQTAGQTNLPAPTTALIGREAETAEVQALVRRQRLVTLTGAGGAGKTRLALRVAADLGLDFPAGVWFAELASVSDAPGVAAALASGVGAVGQSTVEGVAAVIGHGTGLVVVDNCEHVIEDAANAIEVLLRSCPNLAVLTTGREPLGLSGEVSWRVPSLSPEESLALFVERVKAADPRLQLDGPKLETAAVVCERLDGIPLAIELAAARLPSLGIEQLAERLDQRFRLLTGGRRGGLARQRTLQAAVDWSYDLLDPEAQRLLRWLGPFVGTFSLAGAENVGREAGLDDIAVLDQLDALVQKSLVVAQDHDGATRYRLLETIRQYALDRLMDTAELVPARDAHLNAIAAWATEERDRLWNAVPPGDVFDVADLEIDNIRGALDWAVEKRDGVSASEIVSATTPMWFARGYAHEGRQRALAIGQLNVGAAGRQLAVAFGAWICGSNSGDVSKEDPVRILELVQKVDEDDTYAFLVPAAIAYATVMSGQPLADVLAVAQEQVVAARRVGHPMIVGMTLQAVSQIRLAMGDLAAARDAFREMIAHSEATELFVGTTRSYSGAATTELMAGDVDAAWELASTGLSVARRFGDRTMTPHLLRSLASIAIARDDLPVAAALAVEAASSVRLSGGPGEIAMCENTIAWIAVLSGDAGNAFNYAEAAVERWREQSRNVLLAAILHTAGEAARLSGREQVAVGHHLEAVDLALEFGDPATVAKPVAGYAGLAASPLTGLAGVAVARGLGDLAATLLGAADEHIVAEGPAHARMLAEIRAGAERVCGDRFDRCFADGRTMSLADVRTLAAQLA